MLLPVVQHFENEHYLEKSDNDKIKVSGLIFPFQLLSRADTMPWVEQHSSDGNHNAFHNKDIKKASRIQGLAF